MSLERTIGINAVLKASKLCQSVFLSIQKDQMSISKLDKSPVTIADFGAQAVVNYLISSSFPNDKIVGEEDSKDLKANPFLLEQVVKLTNETLDSNLTANQVTDLIDRGNYEGGKKQRFWTLDPIDGTKGFLRGGQYAVGLALIENGVVQMSFLACPNMKVSGSDSEKGRLFTATKGCGAFGRTFNNPDETKISVSELSDLSKMRFCESVESGHSSHSDSEKIAEILGIRTKPVRLDSMCKYAIVSSGEADIYLRLPVNMAYEEKIWDHAPGSLLIAEAGGSICDCYGNPLDFGQGRTLKSKGVIVSNGKVHQKILEAVQKVINLP